MISLLSFFLSVLLQMLSCLEYMYHDLGLVKEFNMNPITLKRWLVMWQQQRTHCLVYCDAHGL